MKRVLEKWTLWLPPLLATLFFLVLSRVTYFRYENSDDFLVARAFLGFEGTSVTSPHLLLHPALVWAFSTLSSAVPGVAWFSAAQLGALWLSAAVMGFCLLRCGRAARLHPAVCGVAALLFLGVFASFACARLTYTTTAALLAAAACALLVCAGVTRRRVGLCVALSAVLLMGGGMLRGTSLPASLCFWLLALACLAPRESAGLTRLTALAAVGLFAAMLVYLAWQGRFLARAVDCALLPAAAVTACLAMAGWPAASRQRVPALCLCALLLLPAGMQLKQTLYTLTRRPDIVSSTREADLEAYALENPDRLIVRTPDLLRDTRLFPDVSAGIPTNTMIWGDWLCRTPGWNAQLARFGFDPEGFTAADFLNDAILFVTADEEPPQALLAYISHGAGRPVTAQLVDARGDLRFFAFR